MIGVDLVYLPEFKKQLKIGGDAFLNKAFSKKELEDLKPEHLAGIWAAKEAIIKAKGNSKLLMKEIIIGYGKNNQPKANLDKEQFDVSIAHHGDYVVAVATETKI